MLSLKWSLALVAAIAASPAMAVYKCKDATGRTVFQERPCEATGSKGNEIEVKPATGTPTPTATAQSPAATAAQGKTSEQMRKENRLRSLEIDIPTAQNRVKSASAQCESEMRAIGNQKGRAMNNLAGATWEQSLSTEMQAVATRCTAEQTRLNADLDRLINEKRQLEQDLRS